MRVAILLPAAAAIVAALGGAGSLGPAGVGYAV
jgi:hypothetical protein